MKILITESQYNIIIEQIQHEEDFHEIIFNSFYFIFESIKNKTKIKFKLIDPIQYKKALNEFITYGSFVRFPVKYIFEWKQLVLRNIALLYALTNIHGHGNSFPFDEFYDVFKTKKQNYHFDDAYDILYRKYNIEEYVPLFSNGHVVLSDYGLKPLFNLSEKLIYQNKPEDIIVIINKILDVAHLRSDLSEIFLKGGQKSHDFVSNDKNLY